MFSYNKWTFKAPALWDDTEVKNFFKTPYEIVAQVVMPPHGHLRKLVLFFIQPVYAALFSGCAFAWEETIIKTDGF